MSKTELTELTETELRLLKLAPLQSSFPVKFDTGSEFAEISQLRQRSISREYNNRPSNQRRLGFGGACSCRIY